MTHAQWHVKLRSCLALVEREPKRALKSLEKLLSQIQGEAKKNVGDWHVEQTLEVISIVQSHLEDHRHSAETLLRVAERHEQQVSYCSALSWRHAQQPPSNLYPRATGVGRDVRFGELHPWLHVCGREKSCLSGHGRLLRRCRIAHEPYPTHPINGGST
jgi:hypothetical protein